MKTLCALLLCLLIAPAGAESISTMELHHRPAAELIPAIKPLLGAGDSITGQGFVLFLRAPAATRQQVEQIVARLDVAAQMLLISVFQGSDRDLRALHLDTQPVQPGADPGVVRGDEGRRDDNAEISLAATRGRVRDNPVHRLRVTEGQPGFIETGRSIPYFSAIPWQAPGAVIGGLEYKDATTGFYVLARRHGDQVTMQISPFKQSLDPQRADALTTERAHTTLTGRLGAWLVLGGSMEQTRESASAIGAYHSTDSRSSANIWIKAEPLE